MVKEGLAMIEIIIVAILYIIFALLLCIRLFKGPTLADRLMAADSLDILTSCALILFAAQNNKGIYLDIALVIVLIGFIETVMVARYMEGKL